MLGGGRDSGGYVLMQVGGGNYLQRAEVHARDRPCLFEGKKSVDK